MTPIQFAEHFGATQILVGLGLFIGFLGANLGELFVASMILGVMGLATLTYTTLHQKGIQ